MSYIEGFVVPVQADKKDVYLKLATTMAAIFQDLGATRVVEAWGDDLPEGKVTDFRRAVQAEAGEEVVLSWVVYPSKAVRDEANRRMRDDPRMAEMGDIPVDGRRMIIGGFEVLLDVGA